MSSSPPPRPNVQLRLPGIHEILPEHVMHMQPGGRGRGHPQPPLPHSMLHYRTPYEPVDSPISPHTTGFSPVTPSAASGFHPSIPRGPPAHGHTGYNTYGSPNHTYAQGASSHSHVYETSVHPRYVGHGGYDLGHPGTTYNPHQGSGLPRSSAYAASSSADGRTHYRDNVRHPQAAPIHADPQQEKKNICPTCYKQFSRPSSLRIHLNTHTGATPFRCPWPNCGKEFNVNSNMRRHYRNHTAELDAEDPQLRSRSRQALHPSDLPSIGMLSMSGDEEDRYSERSF